MLRSSAGIVLRGSSGGVLGMALSEFKNVNGLLEVEFEALELVTLSS